MANYIIKKFEEKTAKSGTKYAKAALLDVEGNVIENVSIFADYPNYPLSVGSQTEGELKNKPYNGKDSFSLSPVRTNTLGRKSNNAAITKAMETKNTNIKEAQTRKEESIKLAAIQRDAVLLTTTFYPEANEVYEHDMPGKEQYIKGRILEWKKWLEQNYGDGQPF